MIRRVLNAVLLIGAAAPLAWGLVAIRSDPRRAVAVGFVLLVGIGLNFTGIVRQRLPLRVWLRVLALLVTAAVLAGVLVMRAATQETLATVSPANSVVREYLGQAIHGAAWLVLALAYLMLSIVALPPDASAGASKPDAPAQ